MTKPMGPIPPGYQADHDGMLLIGSRRADALVGEAGDTPLFVYDLGLVDAKIAAFRAAFPDVHLHYAMKANPYAPLLKHVARKVDGVDIASAGEMDLALEAGVKPGLISFAGPGKRDGDLSDAIHEGVTLNAESQGEVERILAIGGKMGRRPRVAVRVNPDFEIKGSGMRMGGGAKPFGVDAARVPALVRHLLESGADEADAELCRRTGEAVTRFASAARRIATTIELEPHAPPALTTVATRNSIAATLHTRRSFSQPRTTFVSRPSLRPSSSTNGFVLSVMPFVSRTMTSFGTRMTLPWPLNADRKRPGLSAVRRRPSGQPRRVRIGIGCIPALPCSGMQQIRQQGRRAGPGAMRWRVMPATSMTRRGVFTTPRCPISTTRMRWPVICCAMPPMPRTRCRNVFCGRSAISTATEVRP